MADRDEHEAVAFFQAMQRSFTDVLTAGRGNPKLVDALASQAFDLFEHNVALQSDGMPDLACHKGCWPCCRLQVTATLPEVALLATTIRHIHASPAGMQIDLPGRIAAAEADAGALDAAGKLASKTACPLVLRGVCIVHPVRPLACRGHAAFDKAACALAIAGREVEVPISQPHANVRALVQNALQAALRESGYAWRSYELIRALHLMLNGEAEAAFWLEDGAGLEPALARGIDWTALGATFDAVAGA